MPFIAVISDQCRRWRAEYSADTTPPAPPRRFLIRQTTFCFFVFTGLMLASCEVNKSAPPAYAPREVIELTRWRVKSAGVTLGRVAKFEIRDPAGPIQFFRITDRAGRWLGHATAKGRFSRRVPFETEEQDLGVLAMKSGVAQLFEVQTPVELEPIPIQVAGQKKQ